MFIKANKNTNKNTISDKNCWVKANTVHKFIFTIDGKSSMLNSMKP